MAKKLRTSSGRVKMTVMFANGTTQTSVTSLSRICKDHIEAEQKQMKEAGQYSHYSSSSLTFDQRMQGTCRNGLLRHNWNLAPNTMVMMWPGMNTFTSPCPSSKAPAWTIWAMMAMMKTIQRGFPTHSRNISTLVFTWTFDACLGVSLTHAMIGMLPCDDMIGGPGCSEMSIFTRPGKTSSPSSSINFSFGSMELTQACRSRV